MSSCLNEKDPHMKNMLTQVCFNAQQSAYRIVSEYSKAEVLKRAHLRNIPSNLPIEKQRATLQDMITREIYILEITHMSLWSNQKLDPLAKKLKLDPKHYHDSVHLAWMIALVIIRDKVPYKFNKKKELVILSSKKKQAFKIKSDIKKEH